MCRCQGPAEDYITFHLSECDYELLFNLDDVIA